MRTRLVGGSIEFEVLHPEKPGVVLWCHPCVISVACPNCESKVGVPCLGATDYRQSTHYIRRNFYELAKKYRFAIPDDVLQTHEATWGFKLQPKTVAPPERVRMEFIEVHEPLMIRQLREHLAGGDDRDAYNLACAAEDEIDALLKNKEPTT